MPRGVAARGILVHKGGVSIIAIMNSNKCNTSPAWEAYKYYVIAKLKHTKHNYYYYTSLSELGQACCWFTNSTLHHSYHNYNNFPGEKL